MKIKENQNILYASDKAKEKDLERESELLAINRILDRRYEVLVELG